MQIVEGVREGKKVKQRTVAHLGVIKSEEDLQRLKKLAQSLIRRLEKEGLEPEQKVDVRELKHQDTVYDGFGLVLDKLLSVTGFDRILHSAQGRRKFDVLKIAQLILAQRFALPSSKLRTYERQEEYGFHNVELQHIYRTMDAIEPYNHAIQKQAYDTILKYLNQPIDCLFFDVTTLYFESEQQDSLRKFGYSKDQKHHTVQVVLALVVNLEGIPLAYELFEGNISETKTLVPLLEDLRKKFQINNVTVVCDRGLASKANVTALQDANFQFVIATKLRSMPNKLNLNDLSTYVPLPNQDFVEEEEKVLYREMEHPQYINTRMVVTYSPARARKDRANRERLLEKLQNKLRGSGESSVKTVISNSGYKKFTTVEKGSGVTINEKAIEEDANWDGFHGLAVSHGSELSTEQALKRYKELWRVEEAFRVTKCTLKTRPIFHWKPSRIKAHVLLCFVNLFLERFLELLLRRAKTPLTPDRIRHALAQVHTISFSDGKNKRNGTMQSALGEDAEKIFRALDLPLERKAQLNCCA